MKRLRLLLLLFTFTVGWVLQLNAQVANEVTWNLLRDENGVKIYYAIGSCDSQNRLWLRVENTTASQIVAHIDLDLNIGTEEAFISQCHLDAAPGEISTFDCSNQSPHVIARVIEIADTGSFTCTIANMTVNVIPD